MAVLTSKSQPIDVSFLPAADLPLQGRIGFTLAPGRKGPGMAGEHQRDLHADMNRLRRVHGATVLVSLITEQEARERVRVPLDVAQAAAEARGMTFHHAPVAAGGVHDDERLVDLVRLLRDQVERGQTVVVHDRAGGGRAATVSAALLIAQGRSAAAAVAAVRKVRQKAIEPAQERQLQRVAQTLGDRSAPLMKVVTRAFDGSDLAYERIPGAMALRSDFSGANTNARILVLTSERAEQVTVLASLPLKVPEGTRGGVGELLHRVNWSLTLGAFELDVDDGEVRYRVSTDVEGGALTEQMVHTMLHFALRNADRLFPAISAVAFAGMAPAEALADPGKAA